MIDTKNSTETSWGLSWEDLFESLQPTPESTKTITEIFEHVSVLLSAADIKHDLFLAGSYGRNTALPTDRAVHLIVILPEFDPSAYHNGHLAPILTALKALSPRQDGLHARFTHSGFAVTITAAGRMRDPPESLLHAPVDSTDIVLRTTCEPLRVSMVAAQPGMARDLCRVAKMWVAEGGFLPGEDTPSEFLTELLVLHAVRETPYADRPYERIFRNFLSLLAGASGVRTFAAWEHYYPRRVVDDAIARALLDLPRGGNIVVVDPACPTTNLAAPVDWAHIRVYARKSLDSMRSTELVESLQIRLSALTKGVEESMSALRRKVEDLEALSAAPRRWAGVVQFGEACLGSDSWSVVTELELRGVMWRINARRARGEEGSGYSGLVDVSLQIVGRLKDVVDVDITYRGSVVNLVFDDKVDHVLIAKKSEVVRNRDYPVQVTIVS